MANDNKEDLKKDDTTSDSDGQADTKGEDKGADDKKEGETVSKEEHDKVVAERDNYKKGLLAKKAKDRSLEKDSNEKDENEEDGSTTSVDVKAEVDKGINTFKDEVKKSNEQRARGIFYKNHPEYLDDSTWQDFIGSDFATKRGTATIEDIIDDLEDGHLLRMKRNGKLNEYLDSQAKEARAEGQAEASAQTAASAGGTGDQKETGKDKASKLTPRGEEIAQGMKIDPEKANKIDPSKDNEIVIS